MNWALGNNNEYFYFSPTFYRQSHSSIYQDNNKQNIVMLVLSPESQASKRSREFHPRVRSGQVRSEKPAEVPDAVAL